MRWWFIYRFWTCWFPIANCQFTKEWPKAIGFGWLRINVSGRRNLEPPMLIIFHSKASSKSLDLKYILTGPFWSTCSLPFFRADSWFHQRNTQRFSTSPCIAASKGSRTKRIEKGAGGLVRRISVRNISKDPGSPGVFSSPPFVFGENLALRLVKCWTICTSSNYKWCMSLDQISYVTSIQSFVFLVAGQFTLVPGWCPKYTQSHSDRFADRSPISSLTPRISGPLRQRSSLAAAAEDPLTARVSEVLSSRYWRWCPWLRWDGFMIGLYFLACDIYIYI